MSTEASSPITLLFVTTSHEDYARLSGIMADCFGRLEFPWKLQPCGSVRSALRLMRDKRIPIVLCEQQIGGGSWKDLLEESAEFAHGTSVIVTSRTADEHLWSEALNRGAYDVLSTPFREDEVGRVLHSAWAHWKYRKHPAEAVRRPRLSVSAAQ
jgi:DNA-binding NtrC family response regulator